MRMKGGVSHLFSLNFSNRPLRRVASANPRYFDASGVVYAFLILNCFKNPPVPSEILRMNRGY